MGGREVAVLATAAGVGLPLTTRAAAARGNWGAIWSRTA